MRILAVAALAALLLVACDSRKAAPAEHKPVAGEKPRAPLVDITTATSLAAVRTAFNAKQGEARFLTLLSPT